jgi:Protein of unknown function (DUF1501)
VDMEQKIRLQITRRQLFGITAKGIGIAALASLLPQNLLGETSTLDPKTGGLLGLPHFPPKAKRVIFLFQSGAPSQVDLFDYKPKLKKLHGTRLPDSVRNASPLRGLTSDTTTFAVVASPFGFQQHGKSGTWISELMPHMAGIVDEIAMIRSLQTNVANHQLSVTLLQTGSPVAGRPCMGAWVSYGLGSENQNLPAFVVLLSKPDASEGDQSLLSRYWNTGFMPSKYQGVAFRTSSDPVAYLSNPPGINKEIQRRVLNDLTGLNQMSYEEYLDPEIEARIAQYEMAYRMQTSMPDLMDLSKEPESVFEMYGPEARKPGTYAANCLLARRLAERDVRFIQLYHRGWDQHNNLIRDIQLQCKGVDQPSAALIRDLKQRGLLEDTLVIWAGEFGRSVYAQTETISDNYGRDHHGHCFTVWMAGGGIKPGISHGETDDFSYNVVRDAVSVYDLQATILRCLGLDHTRLTYKFQGRRFRLTDVSGEVVEKVLV